MVRKLIEKAIFFLIYIYIYDRLNWISVVGSASEFYVTRKRFGNQRYSSGYVP